MTQNQFIHASRELIRLVAMAPSCRRTLRRAWSLCSFMMLMAATAASAQPLFLSGTIGKVPVFLRLTNDNGSLSGWYVYLRVGKKINLSGTLTRDGAFALEEFSRDDPKQKTGIFSGRAAQGHWTGNWRKPEGGSELDVVLSENHSTTADSTIDTHCATAETDKRAGDTSKYALALTATNGTLRKFSLAQRTISRSGVEQGCIIGLDDLKPVKSDVGLLLQTNDLAEDKTPRCTIRLIDAGDYMFVEIGDMTAKDNDCRYGEEAAYCSPGWFWADMIVDRKSAACRPVR